MTIVRADDEQETTPATPVRYVDWERYCELVVSRRNLARVRTASQAHRLVERETGLVFELVPESSPSAAARDEG